ncbi:hypothetical protein [Nocardioides hungaricus]
MATSPVPPAAPVWWQRAHQVGQALIPDPQMVVVGQLGRGRKSVLARRLYLEAMRRSGPPVMVLDKAPASKPLDLSSVTRRVLDLLAWGPGPSSSSSSSTGEW